MKFSRLAIFAAAVLVAPTTVSAQGGTTINEPGVCTGDIVIDFSTLPDGPLPTNALTSEGIQDIACIVDGGLQEQCVIQGGELIVPNAAFEIAVIFSDALYTAGFELTVSFPSAPPPIHPVTVDGLPAIDGLVDDGMGGIMELGPNFLPINLPASYPGVTTTQYLTNDFFAVAIFAVAPMAVQKLSYLCDTVTGGSDPHFNRWRQKRRDTFHGECDMVMLSSEKFHQGAGFDLHARTTIDTYYSYVESAAVRIGEHILEIASATKVYLDGVEHEMNDSNVIEIPSQNGEPYTYSNLETTAEKSTFRLFMNTSELRFRFFQHFLTIDIFGGAAEFGDSVGLMGNYTDGSMWSRAGEPFVGDYQQYGFEWQVNTGEGDPHLFMDKDRAPQLPYERCRMPTEARPQRRQLRAGNSELYEQAMKACSAVAKKDDVDLCVQDVMTTGELGLAQIW